MITTTLNAEFLDGIADLEPVDRGMRPHRLPPHIRDLDADPQLSLMEAQPSGARVAVVTEARRIELEVHATRVGYRMIPRPRGAIDVVVDGVHEQTYSLTEGDAVELDVATGGSSATAGSAETVVLEGMPAGRKTVEFWLPHNEAVDLVQLRADAPVEPAPKTGLLWVHHGSSISQGSNATHPTGIWPAIAARRSGVRLRNLGFGGSALVDPFLARVIRDTPADIISVKLGINVVNLDAMRLRSFVPAVHGFLDTIRDGHPATPLLLMSPLHCGIHEETPGPGSVDIASIGTDLVQFTATGTHGDTAQGRLTLQVIRQALAEVVAARPEDPNLHYLDGLELYGAADAEAHPLPDALHPDAETHRLIGNRFTDLAFAPRGTFGKA
ncbi:MULTISPECIES: GDSL-type esterase/lipase family protein [unclassified Microbacterium]|uniref:GDSL-type esterase/lipase family protein n=1 Tax=unclassified Microbacterium TaxID=2609290 RepID=UPI000EA83E9A|nr:MULTISPECIES: GDSL-type esterase/lipase family protein [unclassified Microbacterium]MBT2486438.1 lipase [Microbacterium sp. ISL-108]RKN69138.1 lipase [Microbacterium sp. CGR2]